MTESIKNKRTSIPLDESPDNMRLVRQITGLSELTNPQINTLWRDLYGQAPPKLSRPHLVRMLAWRLQEIVHGGLEPEVKDRLKRDIAVLSVRGRVPGKIIKPRIGVQFERLWHGQRYIVVVRENGFEWEGQLYPSLSAVARTITGRKAISGPRFFGLEETGYGRKR